jgi:hypothetical protein
MEKLKEYANLYLERKQYQDKVKDLTDKITAMELYLLEHMANEGAEKVSMPDGITVSMREQIWPKYGHKSIAIEAIKAARIPGLIEEGFNHNRLASYIREKLKSGEDLPKEFAGKITADPVQKLVAKKL